MLQNTEVMAELGIDPQMMQAILGGGLAGGGGGGGGGGMAQQVQAQLNEEDEEAIQRLMALGFPRGVVIQVRRHATFRSRSTHHPTRGRGTTRTRTHTTHGTP